MSFALIIFDQAGHILDLYVPCSRQMHSLLRSFPVVMVAFLICTKLTVRSSEDSERKAKDSEDESQWLFEPFARH
jgi:hypothetical protein